MDKKFNDELISAYLDGELSRAEAADVERALEEDPKLRRMLEELSTLQHGLQTLAPHEYDRDCSDSVLRRAERAMLLDSSKDTNPARSNDDRPSPASLSPSNDSSSSKNWLAAIALVAAAVVLVIMAAPDLTDQGLGTALTSPDAVRIKCG